MPPPHQSRHSQPWPPLVSLLLSAGAVATLAPFMDERSSRVLTGVAQGHQDRFRALRRLQLQYADPGVVSVRALVGLPLQPALVHRYVCVLCAPASGSGIGPNSACEGAATWESLNLWVSWMVISCGVSMNLPLVGRAGGVPAPLGRFLFHCTTSV